PADGYGEVLQQRHERLRAVQDAPLQFGDSPTPERYQRLLHAAHQRGARIVAKVVAVAVIDGFDQQFEFDVQALRTHLNLPRPEAARHGSAKTAGRDQWVWPGNRWRRLAGSAP